MGDNKISEAVDTFIGEVASKLDDAGRCLGDYERFRSDVRDAVMSSLPHLQGEAVPVEVPTGAIVNGAAFADRLERDYQFECQAGPLVNCSDYVEFRRCFDHLAQWASQLPTLYTHPQPAELSEVSGNSGELPPPDEKLLRFYDVSTYPQLVAALEEHVMKLLDLRKRNVKPWEDTFPPTLLPKYERDQHPVFAKDLLALADKWQDAAAETWGEGPVNSTKQDCCDELRDVVSASIYARSGLAATGKQQGAEVQS